jgi:phosphomannomutase / phosphoglucomutase
LMKENQKKDTTDGIKIIFDKSNWVMVRQSGTEPIIRIYAESDSPEKLNDLFTKYMLKIKLILGR